MSTIMRSTDDPEITQKLLKFIDALRSGEDVEAASASSGLDRDTTASFLMAIKDSLEAEATEDDTPQRGRAGREPLRLVALTDGASRGNPGEAACGVIITDTKGEELLRRAKRLGVTTNNVAEYQGVIFGLELAGQLNATEIVLKLDSELVVRQLNGEYKVRHEALKPLFQRTKEMMRQFDNVDFVHVPREETRAADKLANDVLDGKTEI